MQTTSDFLKNLEGRGSLGIRVVLKPQLKRRDPFAATRHYVQELITHLGPVIGALVFDVASFEVCGSGGRNQLALLTRRAQKRVPVLLDIGQSGASAVELLREFPGTAIYNLPATPTSGYKELLEAAQANRGAVIVRLRHSHCVLPWVENTNFANVAISGWHLHRNAELASEYREGRWSRLGISLPQCSQSDLLQVSALLPFCPIVIPNVSVESMVWAEGVIAIPDDRRLRVKAQKDIERTLQFGAWVALQGRGAVLAR